MSDNDKKKDEHGNILAVDFEVYIANAKGYAHLNGTDITLYDFSKKLKDACGPHSAVCALTMFQDSKKTAVLTVSDQDTFYEVSGIKNYGDDSGIGETNLAAIDKERNCFDMAGFVKSFSYVPKGRIIIESEVGKSDLKKPKVFEKRVSKWQV